MFEQSTGHRLRSEKVTGPHLRARRPLVNHNLATVLTFDKGTSLFTACLGHWAILLVVWSGLFPARLVRISVGSSTLVGSNVVNL